MNPIQKSFFENSDNYIDNSNVLAEYIQYNNDNQTFVEEPNYRTLFLSFEGGMFMASLYLATVRLAT